MKLDFAHMSLKMSVKIALPLCLVVMLFGVAPVFAASTGWTNNGTITTPPNIDATNFVNNGTMSFFTTTELPFRTRNTYNFLNKGTMVSVVGWQLDCRPNGGPAIWASTFTNTSVGTIQGLSFGSLVVSNASGGVQSIVSNALPVGYLIVAATNIANQGTLVGDVYSQVSLTGSNINLSRGGIQIMAVPATGGFNDENHGNFTAAASVYDKLWGQGTLADVNPASVFSGGFFSSVKQLAVTETCNGSGQVTAGFQVNKSDFRTFQPADNFITVTLTNTGFDPVKMTVGVVTNFTTNILNHLTFATTNTPGGSNTFTFSITNTITTISNNIIGGLILTTNWSTNVLTTNMFFVSKTNNLFVVSNSFNTNMFFVINNASTNFFNVTNVAFNVVSNITNNGFTFVPDKNLNLTFCSNYLRQAIFVMADSNSLAVNTGFRGNAKSNSTNFFDDAVVSLSVVITNLVTKLPETNFISMVDTLVSRPDLGGTYPDTFLNPYADCVTTTYRPQNYEMTRNSAGATPGSGSVPSDYLHQIDFTNRAVNINCITYSADVINQAVQLPLNSPPDQLPGRVKITANNLNLNLAGIRAEGQVVIQATNLISSTNATIDCENLSYNLGSTSGFLNITNLSKPQVNRLNGSVALWSGHWADVERVIFTSFDTNGAPALITNNIIINLHVFTVNASALNTKNSVTVQDLILHSTNVLISDPMTVANGLYFDSTSLTVNNSLSLEDNLQNWIYTNAPNLFFFTNNSFLSIPNEANFGNDAMAPYKAFVNNGFIVSGGETINALLYQNTSGIEETAAGNFVLNANVANILLGTVNSDQDINLSGGSLLMSDGNLFALGAINFNLTNLLSDSGTFFQNQIFCQSGFNLLTKPAAGDLLATTITSLATNGPEIDSVWAAEDRGTSVAGFTNNAAIGNLTLASGGTGIPLFVFSGMNNTNAMYVDELDLSQLSAGDFDDLSQRLQINPNLTIYFAAAKLSFIPPSKTVGTNIVSQEPEEFLNGQFDGHLVWVSSFAGPNSSTTVSINGANVSVNNALRNSQIIDSNGDGIPNAFDPNPFGFEMNIALTNQPTSKVVLSWAAAAHTIYQIESATNLISPNWQILFWYTNNTDTNQTLNLLDTNQILNSRFYREQAILPP